MDTRIFRSVLDGTVHEEFVLGTNKNALFSPASISGLQIWHRSDSVALSGSNVTQWNDLSGNGRHAQVINSSTNPTYTASDASFNNHPSITFGTSAQMRFEYSGLSINSTQWTFIFVCKPTSNSGTDTLFDAQSGRLSCYSMHSTPSSYAYFDGAVQVVGGTVNTNTKILEYSLNSVSNVGELFIDGTSTGTTDTYASKNIGGAVGLGGRPNALGGTNVFDGKMAEFILYNKILTTNERAQLIGYFDYT